MAKIEFPKDFEFGCASSGPQSEGSVGKLNDSIWDYWFKEAPDQFHNGIGSDVCNDFYNNYKEQISIMKELNIKSFRNFYSVDKIDKKF